MVLVVALLALAGIQEDADISRWISDLGNEEIARRDGAEKQLIKAGAAALPAVRKALESERFAKESETRVRLENIQRIVGENIHDARYRPFALDLVTFDGEETTVGDAFKALQNVMQCVFTSSVDPSRRVRIAGKDLPFRQVLDTIEDQLDVSVRRGKSGEYEVEPKRAKRPPRTYLPGSTLEVERHPLIKDGKREGCMVVINVEESGFTYLDKFQISGKGDRELPLEYCRKCGNKIFLKAESNESLRLRIEGDVVWSSHYMLEVANPRKSQDFRVGGVAVAYEFFKIRMTEAPNVSDRMLTEAHLGGKSKSQGSLGFLGSVRRIESDDVEHPDWCDPEKPPHRPSGYRINNRDIIDMNPDGKMNPTDIESVQISISKPIREPFKVEIAIPAE